MTRRRGAQEPTTLGQFILDRMATCGYETQDDLAQAMGVPQGTVWRWIYKPHQPTPTSLAKLAGALDTPAGDLFMLAYALGEPGPRTGEPALDDAVEKLRRLTPQQLRRALALIDLLVGTDGDDNSETA